MKFYDFMANSRTVKLNGWKSSKYHHDIEYET